MAETNGHGGARPLGVYAIPEQREGEKVFWTKIGIAFHNRDGSINIILEALPLGTNKLQVREQKDRTEGRAQGAGGPRRNGFETVEVRP